MDSNPDNLYASARLHPQLQPKPRKLKKPENLILPIKPFPSSRTRIEEASLISLDEPFGPNESAKDRDVEGIASWLLDREFRIAFHFKKDDEIRRAHLNRPIYFNADDDQKLSIFLRNPDMKVDQKIHKIKIKSCKGSRENFLFSQMIMINPSDDESFEPFKDKYWNSLDRNFSVCPKVQGFESRKSSGCKSECIVIGLNAAAITTCCQFIERLKRDNRVYSFSPSTYRIEFLSMLEKSGISDYFLLSSTFKFQKEIHGAFLIKLLLSFSDAELMKLLDFRPIPVFKFYEIQHPKFKDKAWIMGRDSANATFNLKREIRAFSNEEPDLDSAKYIF